MLSLQQLAQALGGDISGGQVSAPGPGHSPKDRSLSVKLDASAPNGFVVNSFANDDPILCRDYVRQKLHLPEWKPKPKNNGDNQWTFISEHVYRNEAGEPFLCVRKMRDTNGRKQYPQYHLDGLQWISGKPKGPKTPYRLPEMIAAPPTQTIYFVEGEKDVDNLAKLGFVATTASEGASARWDPALTRYFKDRPILILPDADAPGRKHGQKVAKELNGVARSVRLLDLFPDRTDGFDVSNWLKDDTAGSKLARMAKEAPEWEPNADAVDSDNADGAEDSTGDDAVIAELAALPPVQYEKRREAAAEQLRIRVMILDKLVEKARADTDDLLDNALCRMKQADALIALAKDVNLFHTPADDAYADVVVAGHRQTYRVRSKAFRSWLSHRFYEARKGAPSSEAMQSALGLIEARALFDGTECNVHVRVAGHEGKLYLDLADQNWRAVEIDNDGWRVITSPPVRFRRAPGMLPLPEPISGGSINALRPLLNVRNDADFVLVVAWLLAALRNVGPYPILVLAGEAGSAKSTLCVLLRDLIDPNSAKLRSLPREDRDLFIAANNAHIICFDNISKLPQWISDTLCRLATGGGFSARQLFSDDAEMLFDVMRPSILNGIQDVATQPDLADRSMMLLLEPISDRQRRTEKELWTAFYEERPRILGALLNAVARGLRDLAHVKLDGKPRMADFGVWLAACEPSLWEPSTFTAAYEANRQAAVGISIEADLVACAVVKWMADAPDWTGTASELLKILGSLVTEAQSRSKDWPSAANALSGRLRHAAPNLRKIGIAVVIDHNSRPRRIAVAKVLPENTGKASSASSASSALNEINHLKPTIPSVRSTGSSSAPTIPLTIRDDAGGDIVGRNPLENRLNVDPDDPDDVLQPFSAAAVESVPRCAQCDGEPAGKDRRLRDSNGEAVCPSEIKGLGSNRAVAPSVNVTAKSACTINTCDGVTALASDLWETEL